jgi:hypothetical protein
MQNAKGTFYLLLRDRLARSNPSRTIVLRGVMRSASLVEENELTSAQHPVDTFSLRWTGLRVDEQGLVRLECEIHYCTDGSIGNGSMDRGRLLAAMDGELLAAVNAAPQSVAKRAFAIDPAGAVMGTKVFWGDVNFIPTVVEGGRLSRVATVEVFTCQEAGEL